MNVISDMDLDQAIAWLELTEQEMQKCIEGLQKSWVYGKNTSVIEGIIKTAARISEDLNELYVRRARLRPKKVP